MDPDIYNSSQLYKYLSSHGHEYHFNLKNETHCRFHFSSFEKLPKDLRSLHKHRFENNSSSAGI